MTNWYSVQGETKFLVYVEKYSHVLYSEAKHNMFITHTGNMFTGRIIAFIVLGLMT